MKVLIACEESQVVCKAFRERGHEAYSADIQEPSGGHPEWHILGDVLPLLNGRCEFKTMDGESHEVAGRWDMIIAFPPCTYLTVTGNRWFNIEKYHDQAMQRIKFRKEAAEFFMKFVNSDCQKIVIENPVGYMNTHYRKPDQIIQPWEFGHSAEKRTCLWLKGVGLLTPTHIVSKPDRIIFNSGKTMAKWYADCWKMTKEERSKTRSRTFPGIGKAMAEQWGQANE